MLSVLISAILSQSFLTEEQNIGCPSVTLNKFRNRLSHSSLDSFSFSSKPLNFRGSRHLRCSKSSIFFDFNPSRDSKYASFPSKLVNLSFNFLMDAYDNDPYTVIYNMLKMLQGCLKSLEYYVSNCLHYNITVIQNSKRKR